MKRLYIHIGYHKTATSSIQKFLFDNQGELRANGINYARTGLAGNTHAELANCLKPEKSGQSESLNLWLKLLEEVENSECPATLISSECFLESKQIPSVLVSLLSGRVEPNIVCYLRPQTEWLESIYNEVVKNSYRRYTGEMYSLREVRLGWMNYHSILSLWSDVFGKEFMCVRAFEPCQLKNESIYEDFTDAIGIKPLTEASVPANQNISLHPTATEFLRRCNTIPMLNPTHEKLVLALQEISKNQLSWLPVFKHKFSRLSEKQYSKLLPEIERCNLLLALNFQQKPDSVHGQFFSAESFSKRTFKNIEDLLNADIEHLLFESLPDELQIYFESVSDSVSKRRPNNEFLPLPHINEEDRLRAVVIRQRIEARELYSMIDQGLSLELGRRKRVFSRIVLLIRNWANRIVHLYWKRFV